MINSEKEKIMRNDNLKIILVLICICLLSTPISTFISDYINVTTDEISISRITNYAWSIRISCLILTMYFLSNNTGQK